LQADDAEDEMQAKIAELEAKIEEILTALPLSNSSTQTEPSFGGGGGGGGVLCFEHDCALEDAIRSHACSLEALACVCPMSFLSGVHYLLPLLS
jgi:hypothetical protein